MLVDSHCHLDFPAFIDELPAVVERAAAAGVARIVTICTELNRAPQVQQLAERFPPVYFAVGLHPNHVAEEDTPTVDQLVELAQHPKMVGIGESGLDFFRNKDTAEQQHAALAVHIEAARRTQLPLIIHARAADTEIGEALTAAYAEQPFTCVMHCFSSSPELARRSLDLGFYLSMSGIATFNNAEELRTIFREAPADRILIETDSPYLAPVPHRGQRNEPSYVRHTCRVGAELRGVTEEEFACTTTANFFRLFSKVPQPDADELRHAD